MEAAMSHADIHLQFGQIAVTKVLSDAVHHLVGRDQVPTKTTPLGDTQYWFKGAQILPPSPKTSVWAKWAAQSILNAWWLVDFAWQLNKEAKFRFGVKDSEHYLRLQEWAVKGIVVTSVFPKAKEGIDRIARRTEFPVVLPEGWLSKIGLDIAKAPVTDIYRAWYKQQTVRLRWTKREKPEFMLIEEKIPF